MQVMIELIGLALLGQLIHVLKKIVTRSDNTRFSISFFVKKNWASLLLNIASVIALIWVAPDIIGSSKVMAVVAGFAGHSLFMDMVGAAKTKFKK